MARAFLPNFGPSEPPRVAVFIDDQIRTFEMSPDLAAQVLAGLASARKPSLLASLVARGREDDR